METPAKPHGIRAHKKLIFVGAGVLVAVAAAYFIYRRRQAKIEADAAAAEAAAVIAENTTTNQTGTPRVGTVGSVYPYGYSGSQISAGGTTTYATPATPAVAAPVPVAPAPVPADPTGGGVAAGTVDGSLDVAHGGGYVNGQYVGSILAYGPGESAPIAINGYDGAAWYSSAAGYTQNQTFDPNTPSPYAGQSGNWVTPSPNVADWYDTSQPLGFGVFDATHTMMWQPGPQ